MSISAIVNGAPHSFAEGSTVADAAALFGVTPGECGIAAAVDGVVVRRRDWRETPIDDGATIEVVRATAGG